jgi:hypothetical protein
MTVAFQGIFGGMSGDFLGFSAFTFQRSFLTGKHERMKT